jgi:hypothetical protein
MHEGNSSNYTIVKISKDDEFMRILMDDDRSLPEKKAGIADL